MLSWLQGPNLSVVPENCHAQSQTRMQHAACRLAPTGSSGLVSGFLACAHQLHPGPVTERGTAGSCPTPLFWLSLDVLRLWKSSTEQPPAQRLSAPGGIYQAGG